MNNRKGVSYKRFYRDRENVVEAILYRDESGEERPAFLIYSINPVYLKDGGFRVEYRLTLRDKVFEPPPPSKYPYQPYIFDSNDELKAPDPEALFEVTLWQFRRFVDVEDEIRILFTSAVMLSYVQELFETIPYIHLLGDNGSGKTHTLQLFAELCYRPLYGVSIPSADLYTFLGSDDRIPTIIEDEIQGIERDLEKSKIWKVGYKRGGKVPRITIKSDGERVIEYYPAYCLKISAGEKLIQLKGLAERFINVNMVEGEPEYDEYTSEDYEAFGELRKHLLLWRMKTLIDSTWPPKLDIPWLKGRMKELYKPLLTVASVHPEHYKTLERFVKEKVEEKMRERRESFEGHLAIATIKLIGRLKTLEIPFEDIWLKLKMELNGLDHPNKPNQMETELFGILTKQKVGRRLREVLGSKTMLKRVEGGVKRVHVFDPMKVLKIAKKIHVTDVTDVTDFQEYKEGLEFLKKGLE